MLIAKKAHSQRENVVELMKGGRRESTMRTIRSEKGATIGPASDGVIAVRAVSSAGEYRRCLHGHVSCPAALIVLLIGFRNRYVTLIQWAWSYFTFERVAYLVSREDEEALRSRATRAGS